MEKKDLYLNGAARLEAVFKQALLEDETKLDILKVKAPIEIYQAFLPEGITVEMAEQVREADSLFKNAMGRAVLDVASDPMWFEDNRPSYVLFMADIGPNDQMQLSIKRTPDESAEVSVAEPASKKDHFLADGYDIHFHKTSTAALFTKSTSTGYKILNNLIDV